jgi:hypothetical protein
MDTYTSLYVSLVVMVAVLVLMAFGFVMYAVFMLLDSIQIYRNQCLLLRDRLNKALEEIRQLKEVV